MHYFIRLSQFIKGSVTVFYFMKTPGTVPRPVFLDPNSLRYEGTFKRQLGAPKLRARSTLQSSAAGCGPRALCPDLNCRLRTGKLTFSGCMAEAVAAT